MNSIRCAGFAFKADKSFKLIADHQECSVSFDVSGEKFLVESFWRAERVGEQNFAGFQTSVSVEQLLN